MASSSQAWSIIDKNNLNKGVKAPIWRMMQEGKNNG